MCLLQVKNPCLKCSCWNWNLVDEAMRVSCKHWVRSRRGTFSLTLSMFSLSRCSSFKTLSSPNDQPKFSSSSSSLLSTLLYASAAKCRRLSKTGEYRRGWWLRGSAATRLTMTTKIQIWTVKNSGAQLKFHGGHKKRFWIYPRTKIICFYPF